LENISLDATVTVGPLYEKHCPHHDLPGPGRLGIAPMIHSTDYGVMLYESAGNWNDNFDRWGRESNDDDDDSFKRHCITLSRILKESNNVYSSSIVTTAMTEDVTKEKEPTLLRATGPPLLSVRAKLAEAKKRRRKLRTMKLS
jgi:hypothetical protein